MLHSIRYFKIYIRLLCNEDFVGLFLRQILLILFNDIGEKRFYGKCKQWSTSYSFELSYHIPLLFLWTKFHSVFFSRCGKLDMFFYPVLLGSRQTAKCKHQNPQKIIFLLFSHAIHEKLSSHVYASYIDNKVQNFHW